MGDETQERPLRPSRRLWRIGAAITIIHTAMLTIMALNVLFANVPGRPAQVDWDVVRGGVRVPLWITMTYEQYSEVHVGILLLSGALAVAAFCQAARKRSFRYLLLPYAVIRGGIACAHIVATHYLVSAGFITTKRGGGGFMVIGDALLEMVVYEILLSIPLLLFGLLSVWSFFSAPKHRPE